MAKEPTWREYYSPMIADIIRQNKGLENKQLKKILQDANPGPYGHQKKIWANEYMRQLGLSKKKDKSDKNQLKLF